MDLSKGDLVLVSNGEQTSTCIVLTERFLISVPAGQGFYYTYCIESGLYGLVYDSEVVTIVSKDFAPDFELSSELFDSHFVYSSDLYEKFSYTPLTLPDDDSDED